MTSTTATVASPSQVSIGSISGLKLVMVSSGIGKLFMHICIIQEYRIYKNILVFVVDRYPQLLGWPTSVGFGAVLSIVLVRSDTSHICGGFTEVPYSSPASGKGQYVTSPSFSASTGPNVRNFDNIWCRNDLFVANNWRQGKYFSQKIYCVDYNILLQV